MTMLDDVASIANGDLGADRTVVLAAVGLFDRRAVLAAHHAAAVPAARRAAIHVVEDEEIADGLAHGWMAADVPLPLELLYAPGNVAEAIRDAARDERGSGADRVVVVVARQALKRAWHRALHDQTADAIVAALAHEHDVLTVVVAVPVGKGTPARRRMTPDVSNTVSNARRRTDHDRAGRVDSAQAADLHQHAPGRTTADWPTPLYPPS